MFHKLLAKIMLLGCLYYGCLSNSSNPSVEDIVFLKDLNKEINTAQNKDKLLLYRSTLLLEEGYNELALEDCEAVWQKKQSQEAALCKNNVYVNQKKYVESIAWLLKCIKQFDSSIEIRCALASSYIEAKQTNKIALLFSTISLQSVTPEQAFRIASLLSDARYYQNALYFCEKACVQLKSGHAYLLKAHLMIKLKQKSALSFIDSIANITALKKKLLPDLYYIYGNYWLAQKRSKKAISYYQKATDIEWRFQSAYIAHAQALKQMEKYEEALTQLTIASEVGTPTKTLMVETADCLLSLHDTLEAISYLKAALLIDKTDTALHHQFERINQK